MLEDPKDPLRVVPDDPKDDYLVALAIESEPSLLAIGTSTKSSSKVSASSRRERHWLYSILDPAHRQRQSYGRPNGAL
jgi:hypothetical protein